MNSRKQRKRTATTDKGADALDRRPQRSYHEAAHAVVARKLGQSCMIEPTEDDIGRAVVYTGHRRYPGGKLEEGFITSFNDYRVVRPLRRR
jgi:hypothetical protein